MPAVAIAVITGSGTYALPGFRAEPVAVDTAFGEVAVHRGDLGGVEVMHISRHGEGHARLSSHVTHQANVWALRQLGAEAVLGVTVCGAVDPDLGLGSLVVFDDLYFLSNRLSDGSLCTLHTEPGGPGRGHWICDRPFSEPLRAALLDGAAAAGHRVRDGGCYGHVDGPRFNTRAEIRMLAACGVTAVSQTAGPETVLAGEAEIPYALVGYVTDYANGVRPEPTPMSELERLIGASSAVFASTLAAALPAAQRADAPSVGTHFRFD
ncbi:MAG: MTAP family purine nucleoside phosphorylase [Actinobacteria bacterium]|nr:MAG: MTAP family purine nucleoside phosphorylase [Actinomycetota bacterium]